MGNENTVIRTFIAISLPGSIHQRLDETIHQIQGQVKTNAARWVAARNIHLTLKFLGEISSQNLQALIEMLKTEAPRTAPFEVKVGGLGAFPSSRRPRVVWVGVEAPPVLLALQKAIDNGAQRLGYAPEDRPFSPHLTLARIAHTATPDEVNQVGVAVSSTPIGQLGSFMVKSVELYRSDLRPGGAIYTPLYSAAFLE